MAKNDVLRQQAEQKAENIQDNLAVLSPEETQLALHELRVHQIELEMQNEELLQAQEELEAVKARYFDLYNLAPVGYCTLNEQGLITEANLTAAALLGLTRDKLVRRQLSGFILPEDQGIYYPFRKKLFATGERQMCEVRMVKNDGTAFWVQIEATAAQDAAGVRVCRTMMSDITERRQAHAELKETNQRLELATRAKSDFLANMSHEIRTPMTAILGYAELLLNEEGLEKAPAHRRQAFETIHRNGKHLLGLINDILDLSKVEAGKMQIEPIRCSPCELLADVVSLMRVRATAKHLKLDIDMAGPLPETIVTDPLRLRQVLVNLVGNAIKFTDQGEVRIAARLTTWGAAVSAARAGETPAPQAARAGETPAPQAVLRFDVTDTGIGMSEEQIGKLFQAFSQVDSSSTRKFGGTGLGLCISKRLTEAMGGKIEVHSTPGKGSTFSVTIDPGPLKGIPMIQNAQEFLRVRPPTPTVATQGEIKLFGRVLLAEDGPDNQRFIAFVLKKAGAEVTLAENGQIAYDEAMAAVAQGTPFDVILMDMQMPVMDGYEATRQLREQGYTGPILALTAHTMAEDRQKCLDAGCDDFASKPIDLQVLLSTVARWTLVPASFVG